MKVLLVSTYELGRQPLHVASPAAALRRAGHDVRALDLSVEPWDAERLAWADCVAFSVYMHTSMRLAIAAAERMRASRPDVPVAFYGLYAPVSRDELVGRLVDRAVAGEYEPGLLAWVEGLDGPPPQPGGDGGAPDGFLVHLGRSDFTLPARDVLPPLDRYAHLEVDAERRMVGAVEASHGCTERCRHCPVPAVYDGRTRVLDVELVMADIDQLARLGARHVTFADPDFLSGPAHARRVVDAFAGEFPDLTFDVTTKVEHVLAHPDLWPAMAEAGCLFVVSAVESLNDEILRLLDKGHTAEQASAAARTLQEHGIEPRPSFLPFTPWTEPADVLDILDFVADHDLVPDVDPVQYSLRLLLPEGSLLLDLPQMQPFLTGYDPAGLTYRWFARHPGTDPLQADLARLVESLDGDALAGYEEVRALVARAAGRPESAAVAPSVRRSSARSRPRLSEPWFCCAEPTSDQLEVVRAP